jgi:hypothetical protein
MILVDVCKGCPDARCQQSAPQRMINVRWIVLQAAKGYSILLLLSGSPHRRPRAVKVFQVAERLGVHIAPPLRWLMVPIDVAEGAPQLNPIFPSPPQTLAPFRPGGHANGGMSYARFLGKPTSWKLCSVHSVDSCPHRALSSPPPLQSQEACCVASPGRTLCVWATTTHERKPKPVDTMPAQSEVTDEEQCPGQGRALAA